MARLGRILKATGGALILATLLNISIDAQVRTRRVRPLSTNNNSPASPVPPCSDGDSSCFFHHTEFIDGPSAVSSVAGVTATSVYAIPYASSTYWGNHVFGITLGERGDEPCYLAVAGSQGTEAWDGCGGAGPRSTRAVNQIETGSLVSLRVCTNNRSGQRGRLVKGVELRWARRLHETNAADRYYEVGRLEQANCANNWGPWVQCPGGQAAHTLLVHHEAVGGRRGAVGLQLDCYATRPVCYSETDEIWANYSPEMVVCRGGEE